MFSSSRFLLTWYGISVMTIETLSPFFDSSVVALARTVIDAAAGRVGVEDALAPDDEAAGRKVRARADRLEHAPCGSRASRRLAAQLDERDDAVDDLPHVVRRDVGRHADGDAGRSVDQQVRERRRQDGRLFGRLVEVGDEVDGLLVEVAPSSLRRASRAAPRCSGRRPADRRRPSRSSPGRRPGGSAC